METIRTQDGEVLWQGQWHTGLMNRCETYTARTQQPIEVWVNKSYVFSIYPKPPEPEAIPVAAPTLTVSQMWRAKYNV